SGRAEHTHDPRAAEPAADEAGGRRGGRARCDRQCGRTFPDPQTGSHHTMKNTSSWLRLVSIAAALGLAAHTAVFAQDFPAPGKPIRIITPLATGGSSDFQARTIGAKLSQELGVPVVVENKPGASTAIAVRELMRSAP